MAKHNRNTAYSRIYKRQAMELDKQFTIVTGCAVIILWELHGWRNVRIGRLSHYVHDIWQECADAEDQASMLEICERETGIEMTLDGLRSYHEFPYLDHKKWQGRKYPTMQEEMYILNQEIQWIPTMMIACLLVALHRKEGWGYQRLSEFANAINEIRKEGHDASYFRKLMREKYNTTIDVTKKN